MAHVHLETPCRKDSPLPLLALLTQQLHGCYGTCQSEAQPVICGLWQQPLQHRWGRHGRIQLGLCQRCSCRKCVCHPAHHLESVRCSVSIVKLHADSEISCMHQWAQQPREQHDLNRPPACDVLPLYRNANSRTCGAASMGETARPFRGLICFEPASIASSCSAAANLDLYGTNACTSGSRALTCTRTTSFHEPNGG